VEHCGSYLGAILSAEATKTYDYRGQVQFLFGLYSFSFIS
jgi:hypothetical protein